MVYLNKMIWVSCFGPYVHFFLYLYFFGVNPDTLSYQFLFAMLYPLGLLGLNFFTEDFRYGVYVPFLFYSHVGFFVAACKEQLDIYYVFILMFCLVVSGVICLLCVDESKKLEKVS